MKNAIAFFSFTENAIPYWYMISGDHVMTYLLGSCHKRQKPQAPTPQAPIRNHQTRKVANAKGLNRNTNLT